MNLRGKNTVVNSGQAAVDFEDDLTWNKWIHNVYMTFYESTCHSLQRLLSIGYGLEGEGTQEASSQLPALNFQAQLGRARTTAGRRGGGACAAAGRQEEGGGGAGGHQ